MRVLISASTFPLHPDDGLPRFVLDLAQALTPGCEVTALVPDAPGVARRERLGEVEVRRFTYFRPRRLQALAYGHGIRDNLRGSLWAKLQPPPFVWMQTRATRALVRSEGIEVVNSHWLIPQGLSTALARGSSGRFRHVLSVHAGDVYMLRRLPFGRALARFVADRSDAVFADGTHVRDSLDELIGRESGAVVQPMGARVEMFRGANGEGSEDSPFSDGYLLFFGRFSEKKGTLYLLRALPEIVARHPGLGLVLIGYGAQEAQLHAEVEQLGIGASVRFVGRKGHTEIGRYLRGCRVAVVPSIVDQHGETEGMPTVVIEAMAAGARVVGSAVDGIPDVIRHGENGWLCRPADPADLAAAVLRALDDPAQSPIAAGARETADRFDWPRVADRYREVFERLTVP